MRCTKVTKALFVRALMVFTIFVCLFVKKIQNKVLLASMKSLIIVKILPVALFRKPPMTLKDFPKAVCDPENRSESKPWIYTGENRKMREKESRKRNLIQLLEQSIELLSVFTEASRNLIIIFLLNQAKKFKTICEWKMYWFHFISPQKNIHLVTQSL